MKAFCIKERFRKPERAAQCQTGCESEPQLGGGGAGQAGSGFSCFLFQAISWSILRHLLDSYKGSRHVPGAVSLQECVSWLQGASGELGRVPPLSELQHPHADLPEPLTIHIGGSAKLP